MPSLPEVTLQGLHVRLEPLSFEHAEALLAAATESRETYALAHVPTDRVEVRRYLETARAEAERGEAAPFATRELRSGRIVGSTRFARPEWWSWPGPPPAPVPSGPDAVEIGWTWLASSAQRTAVNTEAKLLMLTHAFETWGVRRVTLKTDARNGRSRAAMERLGCRFEGVLRAHMPAKDSGVRDSAMYSLLAAEWPGVRATLEAKLKAHPASESTRLPP